MAFVREAQEALLDKRLQRVEVGLADLLCGLEGATPYEEREAAEERLLRSREEVVAPFDRGMQRALAPWDIVRTAGQERQSFLQTLEDLVRRQRDHAGGSQLDRERQVVQAATDLRDHPGRSEVGNGRSRACVEQLDCLLLDERRDGVLLLAGHVQRLPAGDEDVQIRAGSDQFSKARAGLYDLLKVVKEKEQMLVVDVTEELSLRPQHLRRLLDHNRRVAEGSERNPPDAMFIAIRRVGGGLDCESRLARAARPGKSKQAHVRTAEELEYLRELSFPLDEWRRRFREVALVERPEGRELTESQLIKAFGKGEIFEPSAGLGR